MNRPTTTIVTPPIRRAILATAFLLGLAFALGPRPGTVHAQQASPAPATSEKSATPSKSITITAEPGRGAKVEVTGAVDAKSDPAPDAAAAADTPGASEPRKPGAGGHSVTIGKHGRVTVDGLGTDREFDSFPEFVRDEPAIAAMVVLIVAVVFLSPVLLIALILWYRFRKARLMNETMVRLAEKGIVPSPEALDALASGSRGSRVTIVRDAAPPGSAPGTAAASPVTETSTRVVIGRRSGWSDLRKGVLMGGVGLALTFYSMLEDREPNAIGLILLFVGLGFVVLWWLEERQQSAAARDAGALPGGSPPAP